MACIRVTVNGEHCSAAALAEDTTSATLQALLNAVAQIVPSVHASAKEIDEALSIRS